jgi:protein-S-isoprenylcysteine O-methyltransferase Ste14
MNETTKFLVFILVSISLTWLSRKTICKPKSHGFYRFFSWEIILVLFLWNMDKWFINPLSFRQLISWTSLSISLLMIIVGVTTFQRHGKIDKNHVDDTLLGIEKTSQLVTTGIYHYIRHPFYSSLFFLGWGIFMKNLTWIGLLLVTINSILLLMTALKEEAENIQFFGSIYQDYMDKTKRFVPFLF